MAFDTKMPCSFCEPEPAPTAASAFMPSRKSSEIRVEVHLLGVRHVVQERLRRPLVGVVIDACSELVAPPVKVGSVCSVRAPASVVDVVAPCVALNGRYIVVLPFIGKTVQSWMSGLCLRYFSISGACTGSGTTKPPFAPVPAISAARCSSDAVEYAPRRSS